MVDNFRNVDAAKPKAKGNSTATAAINAGADLIADITVGLINAKTERDFNEAKIREMEAERKQQFITDEQKRSLDLKIANLNAANKKLETVIENLTEQKVEAIRSNAKLISDKLKYSGDKTILIVGALGVILLIGTVYILNK